MRLTRLAPADDERARDEIAEKLGVARGDINEIRVTDWISGEVLVSFRGGKELCRTYLEPAVPKQ